MVPRGAFTVPLLLVCAVSAITVLPPLPDPENVTLSCDNLKTTVSWKYRDREPGTSFIVTIISSDAKEQEQKTSDLHFDLTSFVWASPQRYNAFHSVNVTAVRQQHRSKPVKSNSLSFNRDKKVNVHCLLDFPPVNLTVDESGRTVRFENPLSFYRELRQAAKQADIDFEFRVSSNSGQLNWTPCPASQPICRYDLQDDLQDECVWLEGHLDWKKIFFVDFRQTERVCPTYPPKDHRVAVAVTLSVLLCVVFLAIGAAVKCILKELAHDNDMPTLLEVDVVKQRPWTHVSQKEVTSLVTVVPMEKRAILGDTDNGTCIDSGASDSSRASVSSGTSVETQSDEGEVAVAWERAHYDCGHATDMGGGDLVQGYN